MWQKINFYTTEIYFQIVVMSEHGPNTVLFIDIQMIDENDIMFIFIFLNNWQATLFPVAM